MKPVHAIPVLLVFAAVLGTVAVIVLRQPEAIHAVGDDGRVTVDGRGTGEVVIANAGLRSGSIPVEDISSDGLPLPARLTLTLAYDPALRAQAARPLSLFGYDVSLAAWRRVASVDDPAAATLTGPFALATRRWTYGVVPDESFSSEAAVVIDQLASFPPAGAVGYRAYVAVTQGGEDFFLLQAGLGSGGCAGVFRSGRSQIVTSHDVSHAGETMRY